MRFVNISIFIGIFREKDIFHYNLALLEEEQMGPKRKRSTFGSLGNIGDPLALCLGGFGMFVNLSYDWGGGLYVPKIFDLFFY